MSTKKVVVRVESARSFRMGAPVRNPLSIAKNRTLIHLGGRARRLRPRLLGGLSLVNAAPFPWQPTSFRCYLLSVFFDDVSALGLLSFFAESLLESALLSDDSDLAAEPPAGFFA